MIEQVTCRECGRKTKPRVPKGGDGSGWFPQRHKANDGKWCDGAYVECAEDRS